MSDKILPSTGAFLMEGRPATFTEVICAGSPVDAKGRQHVCQDETATIVNRRWICHCPGGPYWRNREAWDDHRRTTEELGLLR